jgi:hypothetical protein
MTRNRIDREEELMSDQLEVDLIVDLNTMDDSGLPWAFLDEAPHPERIVPGSYVVAGSGAARAVARVVDVEGGIVHVQPVLGSVTSNASLLTTRKIAS